jgi:zinc D-Ala-D-Ala carboxypeptidase
MNRVICPRCWGRNNPYCDKCDNHGSIEDTKLSKDFSLSEFTFSPTAKKNFLQNDATTRQVERLRGFCQELLQPLRDMVGYIHVTSGLRGPQLNKAVGGSPDSAHLHAYAGDLQFRSPSTRLDAMHWLWGSTIPFDQAILEYGTRESEESDDWLHLGWKRASGIQRRQFLVMRNGTYTPWTP